MHTITAIIRCKPNRQDVLREALLVVAAHVTANEPGTIGFFVAQDAIDPCLFTTYERFADQAAMDLHNASDAVARCFATVRPIMDGAVTLLTGHELSCKP